VEFFFAGAAIALIAAMVWALTWNNSRRG